EAPRTFPGRAQDPYGEIHRGRPRYKPPSRGRAPPRDSNRGLPSASLPIRQSRHPRTERRCARSSLKADTRAQAALLSRAVKVRGILSREEEDFHFGAFSFGRERKYLDRIYRIYGISRQKTKGTLRTPLRKTSVLRRSNPLLLLFFFVVSALPEEPKQENKD